MKDKRLFACVLFALAAAAVQPMLAQEVSAGITGTITDSSGAAIVGATVEATDMDRGTQWPTVTNEEGIYFYPRIPAGTYELRIEAAGFKAATRSAIQLAVNQRARVDVALEVGDVSESVEVVGQAPVLNTDTTIVGSTLDSNTLRDVPLASRNFIELTLLTAGVTTTNLSAMRNSVRTSGSGRPYVNGNRAQANNFMLDGIDNNQVSDNLTAYQPNVDAIEEVKVITNNASAEFGNFQGGIISVVMKSGANAFHGSAFEFLQNDKLNANNWARNWQGLDRTPDRLNTFGAAGGGRILRDRLFFFANYQGIRRSQPGAPSSLNVIPAEFRQGDFARLMTERNTQLYDPLNTDAGGNRLPFENNQIPLARMDPVAEQLLGSPNLYPQPLNSGLRFNQTNTRSNRTTTDQGDIKFDYKPSASDDISVRYSKGRQERPGTSQFPVIFGSFNTAPFQAGVVNWTKTVSPAIVNEARFGVNRITLDNGGTDNGLGNIGEQLGITGSNSRGPGLLSMQFSGGLASNIGSSNIGSQALFANTSFHLADNLTLVRGRHMIKLGGQIIRQRMNTLYTGNTGRTGFIQFNGQFTGKNASSTGLAEADFFLGAPSRSGRGVTDLWGHRKTIYGIYAQDDWRVTNSLTLNLGIRWEYHTPLVEVYDRQANYAPFTGELLLAGEGGNSRALYKPFKKDFQPRVGFAWTPELLSGRTVVRGAYTISSFMEGSGTNLRLPINPPFQQESEARFDDGSFVRPPITTSQGITALSGADPFLNANIRLWDQGVRPANTQQWSLILEHQLPGQTVVTAGYIGQKGDHLIVAMPYFQRQLLADGSTSPSPFLAGNPRLDRISQISGTESNGSMIYNGLQLTAKKRMSAGLNFSGAYTWSKTMTNSLGFFGDSGQVGGPSAYWQNLYDKQAEWGPAFFDAAHSFQGSFLYELPFGSGKPFGSGWNAITNGALGGWQLSGILYLRSGFAMTARGRDVTGTGSRGARADRIGDGTNGPRTVGPGGEWFDTSAYSQPAAGTFGNAGNGTFRGPGLTNLDLSLQKNFAVKETMQLQFRAEAFNISNTPAFQGLQRTVTSATFGELTGSQGERRYQLGLKFLF